MSRFRDRAIRDRMAVAAGGPGHHRLVDELADEVVQLHAGDVPSPEDPEVLGVLIAVIKEDATSAAAALAADVLAVAGHRRGLERAASVDAALVDAVAHCLEDAAETPNLAPFVNALAELSATRPVCEAVPLMRRVLATARQERNPSLVTVDGALAVLRFALGAKWRQELSRWFPDRGSEDVVAEAASLVTPYDERATRGREVRGPEQAPD